MAQLAGQLLTTSEVCNSKGILCSTNLYLLITVEKTKITKKRPGMAYLKNTCLRSWASKALFLGQFYDKA